MVEALEEMVDEGRRSFLGLGRDVDRTPKVERTPDQKVAATITPAEETSFADDYAQDIEEATQGVEAKTEGYTRRDVLGYLVKGAVALALSSPLLKAANALAGSNIEKIVYDKSAGKSNLDEKVKVDGKDSLVLFGTYDKIVDGERNERIVFEKLAKKYGHIFDFLEYDASLENDYRYIGMVDGRYKVDFGPEAKAEGIKASPSVAMYKNGELIDIRQGGPVKEGIKNNFKICDLWVRYNLTDEFADKPYTFLFENSFDIHKVMK